LPLRPALLSLLAEQALGAATLPARPTCSPDFAWRHAGRSEGYVLPPRAGLVNELVEAKHQLQLRRVMARWSRYDLIALLCRCGEGPNSLRVGLSI